MLERLLTVAAGSTAVLVVVGVATGANDRVILTGVGVLAVILLWRLFADADDW